MPPEVSTTSNTSDATITIEDLALLPVEDVEVRSMAKREIDVKLVGWDTPINTLQGPEMFVRGAFDDINPDDVLLMEPEHEARIGLGQDGRPGLVRRPVGKGIAIDASVPMVTFRVAKTASGDELLALADDRVLKNVSMEFRELDGGTTTKLVNGRRTRIHARVALPGVVLTYRPAYSDASVLAVRSAPQEDPMPPTVTPAEEPQEFDPTAFASAFFERLTAFDAAQAEQHRVRMEEIETRTRMDFAIPSAHDEPKLSRGEWVETVLKLLTGDRLPDIQMRALADIITTDNAGIVPPAFSTELIGVIDASRPFLSTTRHIPTPDTGLKLTVPVLTQRPIVGVQDPEKELVASQKTIITATDFDAITIAGAGDSSIQILKRSSRSFLDLWLELLAEAYAIESETQSVDALVAAIGGTPGAIDPESLTLGPAFAASFGATRRPPDTMWLSTDAVAGFIDAKATTTNAPLYSNLTASATAAGGISGNISGLRAVHVPALDAGSIDVLVGPSSGFAWAEDGTYTLQVDVPSKAGRDVGLVGILWAAPWYPAAFSAYHL